MTQVELASALRSIPGVEDAEVGDEGGDREGVRVRLAADADPNAVAEAVRAMLADRGLRSRMAPPRVRVEPTAAPPPPRPISKTPTQPEDEARFIEETRVPGDHPREVEHARPGDEEPLDDLIPPEDAGSDTAGPVTTHEAEPDRAAPGGDEPDRLDTATRAPGTPSEVEVTQRAAEQPQLVDPWESGQQTAIQTGRAMGGIASLRLEEDRHGVTITAVANDGTMAVRKSRPHEDAIRNGVIATVSALFDPQAPAPFVVAIRESVIADGEIVTVVLDDPGGERLVGAAVVGAEPAFAIARATFAAMSDR